MQKDEKASELEELNVENIPKDAIESPDETTIPEANVKDDVIDEAKSDRSSESEIEEKPLEALLYDDIGSSYKPETGEEALEFEYFLMNYKAHISKSMSKDTEEEASESNSTEPSSIENLPENTADTESCAMESKTEVEDSTPLETALDGAPSTGIERQTDEKKAVEEWSDEITLVPEIYEAPDEEDNIFRAVPLPEEEPEEDEFSIGREIYEDEEEDIQLSIRFDESEAEITEPNKPHSEYKYDPEKPRFIDTVYDTVEMFVIVLVCLMVLTTFAFKHSIVKGNSMLNTLEDGDSLIISDMFYTPERYDIVVFEDYSTSLKKTVVKRVIGLPGDTVEVKINDNKDYEVYINGELLAEEYALNIPDHSTPLTGVWEIEEGEVFVMGDNRYNSTDSRNGSVGPIDIECILGKVIIRIYPFDKFGKVE